MLNWYLTSGKRPFDIIASALGIAMLSPLLIIVAIIIKVISPGHVIYCQKRIGLNFKPFLLYKFRSMYINADSTGNTVTIKGDSRITPIGRILRKTKLDELPQLFNVLKGDMSLVGPRPEVEKYVMMFEADYRTVLSVRPGITDYAAIEYRNEEAVLAAYADPQAAYEREILPAKIALYKKYISELSFMTDIKILARTFAAVIGK